MTAALDPLEGLCDALVADTAVNALISGRCFGGELPQSEVTSMPRKAVLLQAAGRGLPSLDRSDMPLQGVRVDCFCYGETPYEAAKVLWAAYGALKALYNYSPNSGAPIKSAVPVAGPIQFRDPTTSWFTTVLTVQVLCSEVSA